MSKLFISVRITESFFTSEEINLIKKELNSCVNKSNFLRKAIKYYIKKERNIKTKELQENNYLSNLKGMDEIRNLLERNQELLVELKNNYNSFENKSEEQIYEGQEQNIKTEKVLSLMNQF